MSPRQHWTQPPVGRATCPDCHGTTEILVEHADPDGRRPSRFVAYECVECEGGTVAIDPLDGVDDGPVAEPDAVPLSTFAEVAMLAAQLGGVSEATLLSAVRVLREDAA